MKRLLIRDRVTLASVAVLAVGLAVLGIATNVLLTRQLSRDASALLRERTEAQLATIDTSSGRMKVRGVEDAALDRRSWAYEGHRAIERPVASSELQRAADSLAGVTRTTERSLHENTRLRATPVFAPDGTKVGTVVVGISLDPYEHSERIARVATAALSLLVLLLGALVARRAVGAALRPVGGMAASAADWSEHDLGRRLNLGPPRDELTALAATLDDLLGRIDAALRHEQRFSAEMAHELRTPLSGVRAEAELALRTPGSAAHRARAARVHPGRVRPDVLGDRHAAGQRAHARAARVGRSRGCRPRRRGVIRAGGSCRGRAPDAARPAAAAARRRRPRPGDPGIGRHCSTTRSVTPSRTSRSRRRQAARAS